MEFPYEIGVKALIKTKTGKYLLLSRTLYNPEEGFRGKGIWEIVGGRIKKEENMLDALLREIQEETGMKIHKSFISSISSELTPTGKYQTIIKKDGTELRRFTVLITIPSEIELILSSEHASYKWLSLEDLINFAETGSLEYYFHEWLKDNLKFIA